MATQWEQREFSNDSCRAICLNPGFLYRLFGLTIAQAYQFFMAKKYGPRWQPYAVRSKYSAEEAKS